MTLGTTRAGGVRSAARYHRATAGIVARAGQEGKMENKLTDKQLVDYAQAIERAELLDLHYVVFTHQEATALMAHIRAQDTELARLRDALHSIEHDAELSADPARAHSGQMSYGELLSGYTALADLARRALDTTS